MSKFLNYPIGYLQVTDFDANGNLVNPELPKDRNILIMIQANFCGFCTKAKPDFQNLANDGEIVCLTIQADGEEKGEKELGEILRKLDPSFRGFPHYVLYREGKRVATHDGGRSKEDLKDFAMKH
jgi:thiol-disulfide isomerase/thioredoxin